MEKQSVIFFFQIIINLILLLKYQKISKIINIYDSPDKIRKFHDRSVPLIGGALVFINFILFLPIIFFTDVNIYPFITSLKEFLYLYLFFTVFFLIGFFDDKKNLSPNSRIFFTSLASLIVIFLDKDLILNSISIFNFEINFSYEIIAIIFTVFCIIVLINALNMIDGINLQFSFYFILVILFITLKKPNVIYPLFLIPMIFFSILNSRSKIFMGDAGTYSISFFLSYIFIKLFNSDLINETEVILMLLIPGAELVRVFFIRVLNKKSPFRGDRNHLHHYLLLKMSPTLSLILFISLCSLPTILNYILPKVISFGIPILLYVLVVYFFKKN